MTTASDREKARAFLSPLWEYLRPTDGAMAIQIAAEDAFVRMLAAVRAETVEQAREWLENTVSVGVGYQMEKALANHGDTNV
jgi:hypothetical protein